MPSRSSPTRSCTSTRAASSPCRTARSRRRQASKPCGSVETRRDAVPRPDRAAQPPELQRAAAVEPGAQAVPAPRPVADPPRLPQAHQRPHDGARASTGTRKASRAARPRWCAMSSASACSVVSRPARGSCSPATPASSASTVGSSATSSRPTSRICPRRRGASPTWRRRTPRAFLAGLRRKTAACSCT